MQLDVRDLGQMGYEAALEVQRQAHARAVEAGASAPAMTLLLVEHVPPVITVSRRPEARAHLTATPEQLAAMGVEVCQTDRGGDITWHGPGQLVAYPIVHLQGLGLGVHTYIRALEEAAIQTCAAFGVPAHREASATGVWCGPQGASARKICAIGVRVSRWVTMHGLALNVAPDMRHWGLIVPCGLVGRPVTSLALERPDAPPSMAEAKTELARALQAALTRPSGSAPSSPLR